MNFFSKLAIIILSVLAIMYIKDTFKPNEKNTAITKKIQQELPITSKNTPIQQTTDDKPATLVAIYYTSTTDGELKKVFKSVPENQNKLSFAIKELINGPTIKERNLGLSSEIPKGTKLLGIKSTDKAIIIDLSNEFQYGGGTESQYSRLHQLIQTVINLNLQKPVYLYLNGEKAEVIGGEGILITQPLSKDSLNE